MNISKKNHFPTYIYLVSCHGRFLNLVAVFAVTVENNDPLFNRKKNNVWNEPLWHESQGVSVRKSQIRKKSIENTLSTIDKKKREKKTKMVLHPRTIHSNDNAHIHYTDDTDNKSESDSIKA